MYHVSSIEDGGGTVIASSSLICPFRSGTGNCVEYVAERTFIRMSPSAQLLNPIP